MHHLKQLLSTGEKQIMKLSNQNYTHQSNPRRDPIQIAAHLEWINLPIVKLIDLYCMIN